MFMKETHLSVDETRRLTADPVRVPEIMNRQQRRAYERALKKENKNG